MKRIIGLCFFLCVACTMWAQEETSTMKYKGLVDLESGIAYNLNTAQAISTNNMQFFTTLTTTHGVQLKQYFVGLGVGYMHSYRDEENIYPLFAAFRYDRINAKWKPFADVRLGIVYDTYWISKVQAYGSISVGFEIYKNIQLSCRGSIFSRPSRYFTANAGVLLSYAF